MTLQAVHILALTVLDTTDSTILRFVVDDPEVHDSVWWGKINQPMQVEKFQGLAAKVRTWLGAKDVLFTQDLYGGADPAHRIKVRLVTTNAWHAMFARNMFIRPAVEDLATFAPNFTVYHAPEYQADPAKRGPAFGLSFTAFAILWLGALWGIVRVLAG